VSGTERLNTIAMMGLGAALAFWFTYFAFGVEQVELPALGVTIIWVIAYFSARYLKTKRAAVNG
jgi:hypothetical protein